jgi:Holliday junction DNA helicase RuvA
MIAFVSGKIKTKTDKSVVIDVSGVGYEVFVTPLFLEKAKENQEVELYTHLYVREDIMELYGFPDSGELSFFKKLISVSGVGPKSALTIMSLASASDLQKAIIHEDASLLTKVSGIGEKTAKRLIVELKNKLEAGDTGESAAKAGSVGDSQAIDGLISLGYSAKEAREALRMVDKDIVNVKDRIKAALKLQGKKD